MAEYPIGTQFITMGRNPDLHTVIDIHTTTNLKGEVVQKRYVTTHEFCGQLVRNCEIVGFTIARGLVKIGGGTLS